MPFDETRVGREEGGGLALAATDNTKWTPAHAASVQGSLEIAATSERERRGNQKWQLYVVDTYEEMQLLNLQRDNSPLLRQEASKVTTAVVKLS